MPVCSQQEHTPPDSWRSRGKSHGALVAAGIAKKQVERAAECVKKYTVSPKQDVVRIVFSDYGRGHNSANARKVQEVYKFCDADGQPAAYTRTCRKDTALARCKAIALLSYVKAQHAAVLQWLSKGPCHHAVFVRITDDTNVFVSPQAGPDRNTDALVQKLLEQDEQDEFQDGSGNEKGIGKSTKGRSGRRKVMPLLGVLQWATLRRGGTGVQEVAAGELSTVQLHANTATLLHRTNKWTLAGCENASAYLGGPEADKLLHDIPIRVVVSCESSVVGKDVFGTDALTANVSLVGNCMSWRGCLQGLVRFANATKGTQFRQRLDNVLTCLVQQAERREVTALPTSIQECRRRHSVLLQMCSTDMCEDDRELILTMLNTSWLDTFEPGHSLLHICEPGCCGNDAVFRCRLRKVLDIMFSHLFTAPLLYRWKNFDGACEYVARGMVVKNLMRAVWALCKNDSADFLEELQQSTMDLDNPDNNPSACQQVRVAKVFQLLCEPDATARFLQALLVTRPLTGYMNTVSFVETVRCRLRMKGRGILKESSKCQDVAPSELMSMSLRILSGAAGWTVVSEYTTLLEAPASDDMWLSDMGLEKQSCVHLLLIGAADAFRRLILPFESLPWSLFKVYNMDDDAAMTSLQSLRLQHRHCELCYDQLFAAVFIDWVLSDNIPLPKQMRRLQHLRLLLGDVLLQLPTSTVDVERSHANIQVDASNHKAVPKRPANIQADSLITHTVLEHSQVKALVEDASLGHMFSKQRLGTVENRDITAQIAQEWQDMPEDQRARFQVEADKMQLARDELAQTALAGSAAEEFVDQDMLSASQVKRLNQSRVDINLQRVAEHTAWKHGLGLSDHMAALRPDFLPSISTTAAFQQLKAEYDSIFNFDASIVPNEKQMPAFRRPCGTCHGGTCQADLGFEEVCKLVTKFHSEVLACRLGTNPFLVSLGVFDVTGEVDIDWEQSWYIVATVALRPLCHTIVHVHDDFGVLKLTHRDGHVHMGTMHRALRTLMSSFLAKDGAAENMSLKAGSLKHRRAAYHSYH
ncbi:unnamed protein product [Symbiodinium sp. CCMP2592]|nr:unnamed protein product [Symbiodinium sp. CCMP2592]